MGGSLRSKSGRFSRNLKHLPRRGLKAHSTVSYQSFTRNEYALNLECPKLSEGGTTLNYHREKTGLKCFDLVTECQISYI